MGVVDDRELARCEQHADVTSVHFDIFRPFAPFGRLLRWSVVQMFHRRCLPVCSSVQSAKVVSGSEDLARQHTSGEGALPMYSLTILRSATWSLGEPVPEGIKVNVMAFFFVLRHARAQAPDPASL
jgi:hypothetical protein